MRTPTLDTGDTVEHSITVEVSHNGNKYWVKTGTTGKVREGETASTTSKRLLNYVTKRTMAAIKEITG